jgi:S1-C subfamily serine protease
MNRISAMIKNDPVKALWRSWLLQAAVKEEDESIVREAQDLIAGCKDAVTSAYKKSYDAKKYYDAFRLFNALDAVGFSTDDGVTRDALVQLCAKNIAALVTAPKQDAPPPISSFIRGTVTVWLDLGIKVERGMGYAASGVGSGFFIDKSGDIITN